MKPLLLKMQAFGPYAKEQNIDFSQLDGRNMFVITGKTGAGKTTIFDAICFGLYGRASGEDRATQDLRSQFAADDLVTEVQLTFQLKGKTYSISRSPQQEKKKSRGEGYTTISAKATLLEIEGDKETLLASSVREVDEWMKNLLQLDATQFRQIVMIPQGEFRKLLISDSKEKEQILQRLFNTENYKKIEETLKHQAQTIKDSIADAIKEKESLEQHILTFIAPDNEEVVTIDTMKKWLEEQSVLLSEQRNTLSSKQQSLEALLQQKNAAEQLLQLFEELASTKMRLEQLQEHEKEILEIKAKLTKAIAAEKVYPYEQQTSQLHTHLTEINTLLQQESEKLAKTMDEVTEVEKSFQSIADKREERESQQVYLTRLLDSKEAMVGLKELRDQQAKLTQEKEILARNTARALDRIKEYEEEQANLSQEMLKTFDRLSELDQWKETVRLKTDKKQMLQTLQKQTVALEGMKDEVTVLKRQLQQQEQQEQEASLHYNLLQQKMIRHQASNLAATLIDDEPCPVCGSTHHPEKNTIATTGVVSEEEVTVAVEELQKRQAELRKTEMKIATTTTKISLEEERIREVTHQLGFTSLLALPVITEEIAKTERALSSSIEKKQELEGLKELIEKLKAQQEHKKVSLDKGKAYLQETQQSLEQITLNLHSVNSQLENATEQVKRIFSTVPELQTFLEKIEEVKNWIEQYDLSYKREEQALRKIRETKLVLQQSVQSLQDQLHVTVKRYEEAEESLSNKLLENNFDTKEAYKESLLSSSAKDQLDQRVTSFERDQRTVLERIQWLEKELQERERPDVTVINSDIAQVREEITVVTDQQQELFSVIQQVSKSIDAISTISREVGVKEKQYETIGNLSDIARGQNSQKLTFERYVLTSFLDDILALANDRLAPMTNGRYQLVRKQDRSKGNVQSGLELLVHDQYTGLERHVKTLSGGESFKASLALALGLADVVQERSGGVSMETMFIDEGFGTLDPESLEQAIETLLTIQQSGRLVGVISHVTELKERLDAHLIVQSGLEGSYARFSIQ